jgi:hypothetical protein
VPIGTPYFCSQIFRRKYLTCIFLYIPYWGIRAPIIILCLLLSSASFSRPISYVGGHTLMVNSTSLTDNIYWHYTPNINYSVGLDYQRDKVSNEYFPSVRFTYLINRKNTAQSQRNLYLKTGVSPNNSNNHFYSLAGDWETRRLFTSFSVKRSSGVGYDMVEQSVKVGIAPYLGAYGDFHTWLMVETKKNNLDNERITYPVLRFLKSGALVEISYHKKTDWDLHLMYRF